MKANKALKRLARIEASLTAVTKRYSAGTPHIREALDDAQAAVTRAKVAVSLQASSRTAKNPPVKPSKSPSKATHEPPKPKRRISEEGMKRIIAATKKRWERVRSEAAKAQPASAGKSARKTTAVKRAVKAAPAKAVRRAAPFKKTASRKPAAKPATAPGQVVTEAAAQ
jgi:hypothetical protein